MHILLLWCSHPPRTSYGTLEKIIEARAIFQFIILISNEPKFIPASIHPTAFSLDCYGKLGSQDTHKYLHVKSKGIIWALCANWVFFWQIHTVHLRRYLLDLVSMAISKLKNSKFNQLLKWDSNDRNDWWCWNSNTQPIKILTAWELKSIDRGLRGPVMPENDEENTYR